MLDLHSPRRWISWIGRSARRVSVLVAGLAVLAAGIAMLALPGPGVLMLLVGLAILATEFAWAERALDRSTTSAAGAAASLTSRRAGRIALAMSGATMVLGGATVAVLFPLWRVAGVSIALAGAVGLCALAPPAQRWIERSTARPPADPSLSRPTPITSEPMIEARSPR